jgi:hypothetical protein
MRPTLFCMAVLLFVAGCGRFDSVTAPDDAATLSGRVTTTAGTPYHPAAVALYEDPQRYSYEKVDPDGRYRIKGLKPGTYSLVLTTGERAMTLEALRETIEIAPGANVRDFVVR